MRTFIIGLVMAVLGYLLQDALGLIGTLAQAVGTIMALVGLVELIASLFKKKSKNDSL